MKVGDLVKMPRHRMYWWSNQVGMVDRIKPIHSGTYMEYRVFVPGKGFAKFGDPDFVEVLSESR